MTPANISTSKKLTIKKASGGSGVNMYVAIADMGRRNIPKNEQQDCACSEREYKRF